MSNERKTDTLTDAMQHAHPTAEPSEALVLKVAQLAEAKASESAWKQAAAQAQSKMMLKFRYALLGALMIVLLSVGLIVGPRVVYGISLLKIATKLQSTPTYLQATSYRLTPDGKSRKVGELHVWRQEKNIRARLERDGYLTIWTQGKFYSSYPESLLVEQGRADFSLEDPSNRIMLMAMDSIAFFYRRSTPLKRLSDGRLLYQRCGHDERTLIRQMPNGAVQELELQVWEEGRWLPFLRTALDTKGSPNPKLFEVRFPGKIVIKPQGSDQISELDYGRTKTVLRSAFMNKQGEVCVNIGIPHTFLDKEALEIKLTDERGRRYLSNGELSAYDTLWFFPAAPGPPAQKVYLTVQLGNQPTIHLAKSVKTSSRLFPDFAYHDGPSNYLHHKMGHIRALLRDQQEQKHWLRVLELTDDERCLRDQRREIVGETNLPVDSWRYRIEALRELGQSKKAREALEHIRFFEEQVERTSWFREEEKLLRPN
jgi:hypothetical protein